jgi:4a-hydroxytetrahydrobiopterin dehydratase
MASALASRRCEACRSDTPPVRGDALVRLLAELGGGWRVVDGPRLVKEYRFRDWREALAFVNRVGEIAEREAHHPDVFLAWGRVRLELWTHAIGGLSENDFVLAAKADAALAS